MGCPLASRAEICRVTIRVVAFNVSGAPGAVFEEGAGFWGFAGGCCAIIEPITTTIAAGNSIQRTTLAREKRIECIRTRFHTTAPMLVQIGNRCTKIITVSLWDDFKKNDMCIAFHIGRNKKRSR